MKVVTTLGGELIICNIAAWPPKQNTAGHWELAVRGESFLFDILDEYYHGCSFEVGELMLRNLLLIKREMFPPEDETEFPTMVFAGVVNLETGVGL